MTLRVKSSSLRGTCILLQFDYNSIFEVIYLMKLNVIITCLFLSHFLCVILRFLFFLSFILLSQFHFVERKIAVTL